MTTKYTARNKYLFFALCFLLLLFSSCRTDNGPTTVLDFDVQVSRIQSHHVWLDIFPKDEFLPYYLDWMPLEEYNEFYASDQAYLDEVTDMLSSMEEIYVRRTCNEGAYMSAILTVPNTTYVVLIAQVDGSKATALRKYQFTSGKENMTSFWLSSWDINVGGDGHITIHPSDTVNTYFWDYELKRTVDADFNGFHSALFYYDIEFYYKYDFFPDILSRGFDEDSLFSYYSRSEIAAGDTISLLAVGFDESGETTPAYMPFWVIYQGPDTSAIVVDAVPDGLESVFYSGRGTSTRGLTPFTHSSVLPFTRHEALSPRSRRIVRSH